MAKIASSFKCIICKQPLNFPQDVSITDFVILMLQFYKVHELCESLENKEKAVTEPVVKKIPKRKQKKDI